MYFAPFEDQIEYKTSGAKDLLHQAKRAVLPLVINENGWWFATAAGEKL